MKGFKKKEKVVPVDENGNPIEEEKKTVDGKAIVKKILAGLGCAGLGIITFLVIGAALVGNDDASSGNEFSNDSDADNGPAATEGSSEASTEE